MQRLSEEKWARVEALFRDAADLKGEALREFVEAECGDDPVVRGELISLLHYDTGDTESIGGFELSAALGAGAASIMADGGLEGQSLGAYRIERELGRGGMSVVYLAERDDGQFRRRVAVKLIKRGMDTDAVIVRLRRERRILAALEHPYIARLLDGGTTADGRPYIVMEYVEGLPVDFYCSRHGLSVRERCELFEKICEAVSYAHRNLVVHRDLKPANILVSEDGTPRLLDFGVARVLEGDAWIEDNQDTRGFAPAFTPEYASPEQVGGGAAGTLSDVYSLGVILRRLLHGIAPPRDLANVLGKATEADPQRRYSSVEQLEADLARWRQGLPVQARPASAAYRIQKFLLRHRIASIAAAVAMAALTAGIAITVWQSGVARQERDVAEQRRRQVEAANAELLEERRRAEEQRNLAESERTLADRRFEEVRELARTFTTDMHDAIAPLPGSTAARKLLVETGLRYYDGLLKDAAGNEELLAEIARGYDKLGDAQGNRFYPNLGDMAGAWESYRKAAAIRAGLKATSTELLADRINGDIRFGQMLLPEGKSDEARTVLTHAVELAGTAGPAAPWKIRMAEARAWAALGDVSFLKGDNQAALVAYRKLLEQAKRFAADPGAGGPSDQGQKEEILSLGYTKVGDALRNLDRPAEAVESLRTALAIDERRAAADPNNARAVRKASITNQMIGYVLVTTGGSGLAKPEQVRAYLDRAVELTEQLVRLDPENRTARDDLVVNLLSLAEWLRTNGRPEESASRLDAALATAEKNTPKNPGFQDGEKLMHIHMSAARALTDMKKYEEALARTEKAAGYIAVMEKATPGTDWTLMRRAELDDARGEAFLGMKDRARALEAFRASTAEYEDLHRRSGGDGEYVEGVSNGHIHIAEIQAEAGDFAAAVSSMQAGLDWLTQLEKMRPLAPDEVATRQESSAKLAQWQEKLTANRR